MDTKTTTKTNTSAMSEICELTDDELDAVSGGKPASEGSAQPVPFLRFDFKEVFVTSA
jgi:bacteriocin-like protein